MLCALLSMLSIYAHGGAACVPNRTDILANNSYAHGAACVLNHNGIPANNSIAEHWAGTTRNETFAALAAAVKLLDDPVVRASDLFVPSERSTYHRDRLDVFDIILRADSAPILPPRVMETLRRAYDICKQAAFSALRSMKPELLRHLMKNDLSIMRLLRYAGDGEVGDLGPHTDSSLYTLHVPLADNFETFIEQSSFFPGSVAEMLTSGKVQAVTHGSSCHEKRTAVVLFLQADSDAIVEASSKMTGQALVNSLFSAAGNLSVPDVSYANAMPRLNLKSIRAYWSFLQHLNEGEDKEAPPSPLPSVVSADGKAFWSHQIEVYRAWLAALQAADIADMPYPPRPIRWLWVAHMLQPKLYAQDCNDIFGMLLPHDTGRDVTEHPSVEFRTWWVKFAGEKFPAFSPHLSRPGLRVDWWKGLDSSAVLYADMMGKHASFSDGDAMDALAQYTRFVLAMDTATTSGREMALGPGTLVDFAWHSHQCNPVAYSNFNRWREEMFGVPFFDHEPCGELNPPDPQWLVNTQDLWAELFPGVDPPVSVADVGGCCCCGGQTHRPPPTLPGNTKELVLSGATASSLFGRYRYSVSNERDLFRYSSRPLFRKIDAHDKTSDTCISMTSDGTPGSVAVWRAIDCASVEDSFADALAKGVNFLYAADPSMTTRNPTEVVGPWFGFDASNTLVEQPNTIAKFTPCPAEAPQCQTKNFTNTTLDMVHPVHYCESIEVIARKYYPSKITSIYMPVIDSENCAAAVFEYLVCPDNMITPNYSSCVACPPGQHNGRYSVSNERHVHCHRFEDVRLCGNNFYNYNDYEAKYFNGSAGECQTCVDGDMYRGCEDGLCRSDGLWNYWKEERDKWLCRSVENCTFDVVCTGVPPVPPTPAPSPKASPTPAPPTAIVAAVLGVAAVAALVSISWDVLGVLCAGGKGAAEEAPAATPAVASSPVAAGDVGAAHADALAVFPVLSATT
jgi:hypothetical protein